MTCRIFPIPNFTWVFPRIALFVILGFSHFYWSDELSWQNDVQNGKSMVQSSLDKPTVWPSSHLAMLDFGLTLAADPKLAFLGVEVFLNQGFVEGSALRISLPYKKNQVCLHKRELIFLLEIFHLNVRIHIPVPTVIYGPLQDRACILVDFAYWSYGAYLPRA